MTRISEVDRKGARAERSGLVTIRVRIDAEGALDGVFIDESSGFPELDERAIRAVQAAAPFGPPPKRLLSLEGYTELSFPLQFEARRRAGADARTP